MQEVTIENSLAAQVLGDAEGLAKVLLRLAE
jgi:hypothetical protein